MSRVREIVLILKPCVQSFIFLIYEKQRSNTEVSTFIQKT